MLKSYVHGDDDSMKELLMDILNSRKFKGIFGDVKNNPSKKKDTFLEALVSDYENAKRKEDNISIRLRSKALNQPIKIAATKGKCQIESVEQFSTRVEAAKNVGRVNTYGAERRRLLSIVALDYPQSFLVSLFNCSKSTVTAARVHCLLFGRGGTPPSSLKFTRQRISQDVLDGLAEFLVRDNVSRPSSCRSVVVNNEECPVRYWQDTIKALVQQYLIEFPNGVKRSYIYANIPKNFRHNSMLAGLCNLCEDFGYSNFENMINLVKKLQAEALQEDLNGVVKEIRHVQRYLKSSFSNEVSN